MHIYISTGIIPLNYLKPSFVGFPSKPHPHKRLELYGMEDKRNLNQVREPNVLHKEIPQPGNTARWSSASKS